MFNKIYRAMVIAQTREAARQLINNSSDRMLADMGIEPGTFVEDMAVRAEAEFTAADTAKPFPKMNPSWAGLY